MAKVFVVQLPTRFDRADRRFMPKHDLGPAERFGELVYLLGPGNVRHGELDGAVADVRRALASMRADDYLLPLGDPVAMALAAALASEVVATLRVLKWDKHVGEYEAYDIRLRGPDGSRGAAIDGPSGAQA